MIDRQPLIQSFKDIYGKEPLLFGAPGRVNLIGEHTDYNGGFVLPAALDRETVTAISSRQDRKIRARSLNINDSAEIDLDRPEKKLRGNWLDYIEGVARVLESRGYKLRGADLAIRSDVPGGAGLSSSAALEVSAALALSEISGHTIDKTELALACQQAEHEYVGARVGIMDQFVAAMGRPGYALLIDCRNLTSEPVKLDTDESVLIICDTNVKHKLAASEYNIRRQECEKAVELLSVFLPGITQLRDVGSAEFFRYADRLPDVIMRRARHIITDSERTLTAAEAMRNRDLVTFGNLMRQSHASMRDDFEISCAELDLMVELAENTGHVFGARMTGGGFGGSTVNLVKKEFADEFVKKVLPEYKKRTGLDGKIYICGAGNGAS
jgi:galactokinase